MGFRLVGGWYFPPIRSPTAFQPNSADCAPIPRPRSRSKSGTPPYSVVTINFRPHDQRAAPHCFLKNGYPYDVINGTITSPQPTAGVAIVDERVNLDKSSWAKLTHDVAGDINARELWAQMIRDVQPQGIVYMLNGNHSDADLVRDVAEMRQDVLALYTDGLGSLSALHVFLNYADQWAATNPAEMLRRRRVVERAIDDARSAMPALVTLKIEVVAVQLAINGKPWDMAFRALRKFGTDMAA